MKTLFRSILSHEHIQSSAQTLSRRFLIPTIFSLAVTIMIWCGIFDDFQTSSFIGRLVFSGIVGFFCAVGVNLWIEGKPAGKYDQWFSLFPLIYALMFYLTLSPSENGGGRDIFYELLQVAGFISLVFFAPYIGQILRMDTNVRSYSNYFSQVAWTFLMSGIVSIATLILGYIAIASINALFGSPIDEHAYGYWAALALAGIGPIYGLLHFPYASKMDHTKYEINRFFAFLIRSICVPAMSIYFFILYAYSIRVLFNWHEWPNGIITWLVIGFSTFGYLIYMFSLPYESENRFIQIFRRYFPALVIPQILMLAYAIYLRIDQYGLTMNRYFVIAFGIWLMILSVYFVFNTKKAIIIIPFTLSIIVLLISIGPWSVFRLPDNIQYNRLIKNLEKAQIIQNGQIIPLKKYEDISPDLSAEISAEIEYLCRYSDCELIQTLFAKELAGGNTSEYWDITGTIESAIKVRPNFMIDNTPPPADPYTIYLAKPDIHPVNISGYDTYLNLGSHFGSAYNDGLYAYMDTPANTLVLMESGTILEQVSIDQFTKSLSGKLSPLYANEINPDLLVTDLIGKHHDIKVVFTQLILKNPAFTGATDHNSGDSSGYIFIKRK